MSWFGERSSSDEFGLLQLVLIRVKLDMVAKDQKITEKVSFVCVLLPCTPMRFITRSRRRWRKVYPFLAPACQ